MKIIILLSFLSGILTIISCKGNSPPTMRGINPKNNIPYSVTDTLEAMEGSQAQYNGSMTRWRDRVSSETDRPIEAYGSGPCIRPNAGFPDTTVAREFMSKSRRYRESLGGRGCICVPMGDLCAPKICNCSEICPNDHGIFKSQADRMMPTPNNQFAFTNDNNPSVYRAFPNNRGGFCTGIQLQHKKFSSIARFKPTLRSWPAMTVPSDQYVNYIKGEIDRMTKGLDPNFLGARNLEELRRKDPRIDAYFRQKTRAPALQTPGTGPGDDILNPVNEATHGDGESYQLHNGSSDEAVVLHFAEQTNANIAQRKAIDTDLDENGNPYGEIPLADTPEFERYLAKKVERISQGFPGTLPGYANVFTLTENPIYHEIIGHYSAIDWNTMNGFDTRQAFEQPPFRRTSDWQTLPFQPMETNESDQLLEKLEERLPTYTGSGTGAWNAGGPWQTVSLEFKGCTDPAVGENASNSVFYHSVEAYALKRQTNGEVRICIADPNHGDTSRNNSSTECKNFMTIPAKDSNGHRAGMSYNSPQFVPRKLGKVGVQPSSDMYQGLLTTRMVEYCRTINRGNFNVQDCGGAP